MKPNKAPQASEAKIRGLLRLAKFESILFDGKNIPSDEARAKLKATPVVVVGIRGYYMKSMGRPTSNDRAVYDDAVFVVTPTTFTSFNANTDPGIWRKGVASLEAPQIVRYKPGYHGYKSKWGHPAFRQNSNVVVHRDGVGRDTDSSSRRFWINNHSGGWGTVSSLGCQTIYKGQWAAYYNLLKFELSRHNEKTFLYLLLEDERI